MRRFQTRRAASHEVGAGWIDPGALGRRLAAPLALLCRGGEGSTFERWLGAVAWFLVILSCWYRLPVPYILADLLRATLGLFQ
jgi:hypothetical protein